MSSIRRLSAVLSTFFLAIATPAIAYDDTWHKTDFWAGEYPPGFTLNKDVVTKLRIEPDPKAPRELNCELKQSSTYHTWNHKRREADNLEFITFVPTVKYRVKKSGTVELHDETADKLIKRTFGADEEWTYLTYYGEGAFRMSYKGVVYGAQQDLFEISEEIKGKPAEKERSSDRWMKLTCSNGTRGWLLLDDVADLPGFDGPNILQYGRAVDLPRIFTAGPQTPVRVEISRWPAGQWPEGLGYDGKSLWVADSGKRRILRLNPKTGKIQKRVKVGRLPQQIFTSPSGQIFPLVATSQIVWSQPQRGKGKALKWFKDYPISLSGNDKALWVLLQGKADHNVGRIVRVDQHTGASKTSDQLPTSNAGSLAFGHGRLWGVHGTSNWGALVRYNADTMRELDQVPMHSLPGFVTSGNGGIFVAGAVGDQGRFLSRFDAESGEEAIRLTLPDNIVAMRTTGDFLIAATLQGRIWIISQTDLSIVRTIDTGAGSFELRDVLPVADTLFATKYNDKETKGYVLAIKGWQP